MLRGSGQLGGGKQWGISDIGMEAIRNIKMVEAARLEAHEIIEKDFELKNYPLLKEKWEEKMVRYILNETQINADKRTADARR